MFRARHLGAVVPFDLFAALAQLLDHMIEVTTEVSDFVVAVGEANRDIQVPSSDAHNLVLKFHPNFPDHLQFLRPPGKDSGTVAQSESCCFGRRGTGRSNVGEQYYLFIAQFIGDFHEICLRCSTRRYSGCAWLRVFPIVHPPIGPPHCDQLPLREDWHCPQGVIAPPSTGSPSS